MAERQYTIFHLDIDSTVMEEDSSPVIFFEVGEGQSAPVQEMLLSAGFSETTALPDTAQTERVVIGRFGVPEP